jgi:multidrug efflux pump
MGRVPQLSTARRPARDIPLLGMLCVPSALCYSINTLTTFAIVLSRGLVVDDAIVVVENVGRLTRKDKL